MPSRRRPTPTRRAWRPWPAGSSGGGGRHDLSVGAPSGIAGARGPESYRSPAGRRRRAGGPRGRRRGGDDRLLVRRHAQHPSHREGPAHGGARSPGAVVSRVGDAAHRGRGPGAVPVADLGTQRAVPHRRARARRAVLPAPQGAAPVDGVHPRRRRAGDERRSGESDAPAAGGKARAGRGARVSGETDRDAGGLPRRGQRRRPAGDRGGDPRVPGGAGRAGPAAVRRRRDQIAGAGGRRAGRGRGLRGRRDGRRAGSAGGPGGVRARGARMTEGGAERVRAGLESLAALAARVAAEEADAVAAIADRYEAVLRGGGTLFFAGNGGSAADAQHLATEYVVRYQNTRPALRAVALTTDTSLLTACANDLGFDEVFARQVEALARPGDLLSLHSTSGESPNVIRAAQAAQARGVPVVAFLGKGGGQGKDLADVSLIVPSDDTARIQELHLAIEHLICDIVEDRLRG